ncbi:hypothetical protein KGQ27_03565 [Patescibacteria group bacterium]|nr:hypothetical protein [Patescibacteria group bacterium]MDE1946959.1 hypothetical protein [Patescibacteria group bacterium]MDE2011232.1 hypothetical protein [Patescibacteria group bacterium]MDE2233396.1 hypothetical protein [Patescibacteria group bacterium]
MARSTTDRVSVERGHELFERMRLAVDGVDADHTIPKATGPVRIDKNSPFTARYTGNRVAWSVPPEKDD